LGLNFSFVLAYHGCEEWVRGELLLGKPFQSSKNEYDWLGHGIYVLGGQPTPRPEVRAATRRRVGAIIEV